MATEAQKRATLKYYADKLDRIAFNVPKGYRDVIVAEASAQGDSVNAFILKAVKFYIEQCVSSDER